MYKIAMTVIAVLLAPAASVFADDAHHPAKGAVVKAAAALTEGTVKKIDKAAGKAVIAHGPLENVGMPAMTMAFPLKDAAWIGKMKEGQKIRFAVEDVNGALTVVRFEPIK